MDLFYDWYIWQSFIRRSLTRATYICRITKRSNHLSVLQYIYIFKPNVFKSVLFRNLTDVLRRVCVYFSDSLLDLLTDSLPRKGAKAITTDCLRLNRGDIFKTEELAASSLLPKAAHYLQYWHYSITLPIVYSGKRTKRLYWFHFFY